MKLKKQLVSPVCYMSWYATMPAEEIAAIALVCWPCTTKCFSTALSPRRQSRWFHRATPRCDTETAASLPRTDHWEYQTVVTPPWVPFFFSFHSDGANGKQLNNRPWYWWQPQSFRRFLWGLRLGTLALAQWQKSHASHLERGGVPSPSLGRSDWLLQ